MSDSPQPERIVAIVGRPNVGKSALFNRLVRRRLAIVHAEEGVTRDRLMARAEWLGQKFRVVDTGGLALMDRAKSGDEILRATADQVQAAIEDSAAVILVVDLTAGLQPLDVEVARLLRQSGRPAVVAANKADLPAQDERAGDFAALIREHHKACVVLVNKWDLAKGTPVKAADYEERMRQELFFLGDIPVVFVSALSGHQIRRSFEVIDAVATRLTTKMPTGVLNRVLRDAFAQSQPPFSKGRQLKFYYATQTGQNPPRVTLFVNDPKLSTPTHQAFLATRLRAAFDLAGVPLVLRYRSSHGERESNDAR